MVIQRDQQTDSGPQYPECKYVSIIHGNQRYLKKFSSEVSREECSDEMETTLNTPLRYTRVSVIQLLLNII